MAETRSTTPQGNGGGNHSNGGRQFHDSRQPTYLRAVRDDGRGTDNRGAVQMAKRAETDAQAATGRARDRVVGAISSAAQATEAGAQRLEAAAMRAAGAVAGAVRGAFSGPPGDNTGGGGRQGR